METLKGNGPEDLLEVVYYLGNLSLKMAGIEDTKEKIDKVIADGSAYEILCKMIHAHGGLLKQIQFAPAKVKYIKSKKEGFINYIDTKQLGLCVNTLTLDKKGNKVRPNIHAGIKMIKKNGLYVNENDIIAEIFCSNKDKLSLAEKMFKSSIIVEDEKRNPNKLIIY